MMVRYGIPQAVPKSWSWPSPSWRHSPHYVQWIGQLGAIAGQSEDRPSDPESAAPEFLPLLLRELSGSLPQGAKSLNFNHWNIWMLMGFWLLAPLLRLTLSTCHYLSDLGLVWSSGCILILWWMLLVNLMSMSLVPFWILWSELSHTISCHFFSQVFAEDVPTVRTLGSNSLLLRVLVLYTYGILCIPLQGSQDVTTEFLGHITGSRFCCASRAKLWPT